MKHLKKFQLFESSLYPSDTPILDLLHWFVNGKWYGYPDCCCLEQLDKLRGLDDISPEQEKVSKNLGFLPCKKHTKQIIKGETTLEGLIQDRGCPTPFPNGEYSKAENKVKAAWEKKYMEKNEQRLIKLLSDHETS